MDEAPAPTALLADDAAGISAAVAALSAGEIVALPSETVYGLAGDATNPHALAAIYAAKGRPDFNPLIIHVADQAMAEEHVVFSPLAQKLADRFWPGPLTLVLPRKAGSTIAAAASAGLPTLAVRCPAHPVMQHVIARLGKPIAAPSANASGQISPTQAAHVLKSLNGRIAAVLDGGACRAGVESTIIGFQNEKPVLLRAGALSAEMLGLDVETDTSHKISAPGQLASHYAPRQNVRLNAQEKRGGEYLIGFGSIAGDDNLSPTGDLAEAATNLFAALHRAEDSGADAIAVAPIPMEGLGVAINDRLKRAAAARD